MTIGCATVHSANSSKGDSGTSCGLKCYQLDSILKAHLHFRRWYSQVTISIIRASKMAQWMKVLATKPENLSSVSGIHTVEGKNQLPEAVS